jgi:molybdopterin/thiamine biosynthesis adenylyltransferase
MDDAALLRYSRHLLLEAIGVAGQQRITGASVLVVGAGGLGSPAAIYLAAAGVGTLRVLDADTVELGNLQRQILHSTERIGQAKADSAALALLALNPGIRIDARRQRLTVDNAASQLDGMDIALDCSDNRATRYALNRACRAAAVPLVSGSASGFAGQLAVFDFRRHDSPCYACLFPPSEGEDEDCATTGVYAPLTGVIGALQAGEALRVLCAFGDSMGGQLLMIDLASMRCERVALRRDPHCAVCGGG